MPSQSSHFRIFDLPREVRDQIWTACLKAQRNPVPAKHHPTKLKYTKMDHQIQIQVLRTSKQVYAEARPMMLRSNRLVKITVDQLNNFSLIVFALEIPVFFYKHNIKQTNRPIWAEMPDDLLLHTTWSLPSWHEGHHGYRTMVILEEDHATLIRILAEEDFRDAHSHKTREMQIQVRHTGAAFCQQAQNSTHAEQLTTRLLAPYARYSWCGYDHAITAEFISPSMKSAILSQMRRQRSDQQRILMTMRRDRNLYLVANRSPEDKEMSLRTTCGDLCAQAAHIRKISPPTNSAREDITYHSDDDGAVHTADTLDNLRSIADEYVFVLMCRARSIMPASTGNSTGGGICSIKRYAVAMNIVAEFKLIDNSVFGIAAVGGSTLGKLAIPQKTLLCSIQVF